MYPEPLISEKKAPVESESVVKLPHLKVSKPSSRAALEWRMLNKPETATGPDVDEGHETRPHFSRVEKLLARFQAKKGAPEHLIDDSPSVVQQLGEDPNVSNSTNPNAKEAHGAPNILSFKPKNVSIATCYLSKPPHMVKWRGLGLVPAEENVVVEILRAKDISKGKLSKSLSLESRVMGSLELLLIEAKGLPRNEQNQSILVFAEIRMYPTDQVEPTAS